MSNVGSQVEASRLHGLVVETLAISRRRIPGESAIRKLARVVDQRRFVLGMISAELNNL